MIAGGIGIGIGPFGGGIDRRHGGRMIGIGGSIRADIGHGWISRDFFLVLVRIRHWRRSTSGGLHCDHGTGTTIVAAATRRSSIMGFRIGSSGRGGILGRNALLLLFSRGGTRLVHFFLPFGGCRLIFGVILLGSLAALWRFLLRHATNPPLPRPRGHGHLIPSRSSNGGYR